MNSGAGELRFVLNISAAEYLHYYRGVARHVITRAQNGSTVQFPAGLLRRFLTHDGVHGEFRLRYDGNNKLLSLERVERGR